MDPEFNLVYELHLKTHHLQQSKLEFTIVIILHSGQSLADADEGVSNFLGICRTCRIFWKQLQWPWPIQVNTECARDRGLYIYTVTNCKWNNFVLLIKQSILPEHVLAGITKTHASICMSKHWALNFLWTWAVWVYFGFGRTLGLDKAKEERNK